jgi:protease II
LINLEEVKKKYFIQSACEIFVGQASEIKTLFTLLEQQQTQLEEANKEIAIANEKIRELKNLRLVKKNMQLEEQNLELDKKLRAANQQVERLLVVKDAYEAYKKAY